MKRIKNFLLALVFCTASVLSAVSFSACFDNNQKPAKKTYSKGLEYQISEDGTYYSVTGMGICEDFDLVIPSSYNNRPVKRIEDKAFVGEKLVTVVIPDSVEYIGEDAFFSPSLVRVEIGEGVTVIGEGAFEDCYNLVEIYNKSAISNKTIKNMVVSTWEYFDWDALTYKTSTEYHVKNIYKPFGGDTKITRDEDGYIIYRDLKDQTLMGYVGTQRHLVLPQDVTRISNYAFINEDIVSVVIGDKVKVIESKAFDSCVRLSSMVIGKNVSSIGDFRDCENLVEVYNKSSLSNGKVNSSVQADNVYSDTLGKSYLSTDENGFQIYDNGYVKALISYKGEESDLVLPEGISTIYPYALSNPDITSVKISDSVEVICKYAFKESDNLKNVEFGANVQKIEERAFSDCSRLTSVKIGDSVKRIEDSAFLDCGNLVRVELGAGLDWMAFGAFEGCYKLVEIYNRSSLNIKPGDIYLSVTIIGDNTHISEPKYYDKDVYTTPHESKVSVGEDGYVLYTDGAQKTLLGYVGNSDTLVLPEDITNIYDYAFKNCNDLQKIIIPDSVVSIGEYAFANCDNLTEIVFGENVAMVDVNVVFDCDKLLKLYYKGTAELWQEIAVETPNQKLWTVKRYYYSETKPTEQGNYWHYDARGEIVHWGE